MSSYCRYRDIGENYLVVQWLWTVLESFSDSERVLFMRFVSGRSRLPANLADLSQRFQVLLKKYKTNFEILFVLFIKTMCKLSLESV